MGDILTRKNIFPNRQFLANLLHAKNVPYLIPNILGVLMIESNLAVGLCCLFFMEHF